MPLAPPRGIGADRLLRPAKEDRSGLVDLNAVTGEVGVLASQAPQPPLRAAQDLGRATGPEVGPGQRASPPGQATVALVGPTVYRARVTARGRREETALHSRRRPPERLGGPTGVDGSLAGRRTCMARRRRHARYWPGCEVAPRLATAPAPRSARPARPRSAPRWPAASPSRPDHMDAARWPEGRARRPPPRNDGCGSGRPGRCRACRGQTPARARPRAGGLQAPCQGCGPDPRRRQGSPSAHRRLPDASVGRRSGRACRARRSEEHTSELQSRENIVCRLLLEKKKKQKLPPSLLKKKKKTKKNK